MTARTCSGTKQTTANKQRQQQKQIPFGDDNQKRQRQEQTTAKRTAAKTGKGSQK
jgi:hypothetical protein